MAEPSNTGPADGKRTFTEGEAYALVADNVQRETAAHVATIETLTSEKAELESKLELAEAATATEKARADGAIEWHDAVLAGIESEKAQLGLKDERVAKVKEVAPHLKDDYFTAEKASRWCALDQEAFDAYVGDLKEIASGSPAATAHTSTPPRETAMQGSQVTPTPVVGGSGSLLSQFLGGPTSKGV